MRLSTTALLLATVACQPSTPEDSDRTTPIGTPTDTATSATAVPQCVSPTQDDLLYPPYPDVPADCLNNHWDCPLEPGYASQNPMTVCNITKGFDTNGQIQAQFWEAYTYAQDYFGHYGPVYVYVMGPGNATSNDRIWKLRGQRRAVVDACTPVAFQVDDFLADPYATEELEAANNGSPGLFSISGNSGCNPLMDMMLINPRLDEVRTITLHEAHHIFQVAHSLTHDRDSEYGLNSWIMEGQATYSAARFGSDTGWGPDFADLMMDMKHFGGNVSPQGIDAFLAANPTFDLADESYWQQPDLTAAAAVYYQLGAWAWAWLVHDQGGDVDKVLKAYIQDVPTLGKSAAFQQHFGRSMDDFFAEFAVFVQGDDDAWRAILESD